MPFLSYKRSKTSNSLKPLNSFPRDLIYLLNMPKMGTIRKVPLLRALSEANFMTSIPLPQSGFKNASKILLMNQGKRENIGRKKETSRWIRLRNFKLAMLQPIGLH